jgi:BCD family chlorophyll transporter-like MFS transporter
MLRKRIQIGLIHLAMAITLTPITSTLNRIMQNELALSATLVGVLASLPYLISPIQVAIGSFSDRNPIFGWRRTPYILIGLALCVGGLMASPYIAYLLVDDLPRGLLFGVLAFGAWGMGYNLATVAYFSLATEISEKDSRSATIAVMFFIMIVGIILTSIALGGMLDVQGDQVVDLPLLSSVFNAVALVALAAGMIGLIGLEKRDIQLNNAGGENFNWGQMLRAVTGNPQATRFFWYLMLLLTAILGQDLLLEAYAGVTFNMAISQTSRITSIWGTPFLVLLALGSLLERQVPKLAQARLGAWSAVAAFMLIIVSGVMGNTSLFYLGVLLLGAATGLATVSNLSLMLNMTTAENVGLYMGAWGMAGALARLTGNVFGGLLRDGGLYLFNNAVLSYMLVFGVEVLMLIVSLVILRGVDVRLFQSKASQSVDYFERAAVAGEGS